MLGESGNLPYDSLLRLEGLSVRPAISAEELEHAYRRVYWSYRKRAYIEENLSSMRLSIFNAFPSTVTFVSVYRGAMIASVTLVMDTEIGLPMDEIYHKELKPLRAAGRKLTEATMFADRRHRDFRRAIPMLFFLMKRVFDYATLIAKANDLCITINPRHEGFFEKFLYFRPLGDLRTYPSVRDNPAVAKRLDLDSVQEEGKDNAELWHIFCEDRTPMELLQNVYGMKCEDLQRFFVEYTSVFRDASQEEIDCVRKHYPDCPWEQWQASW